MPRRKSTGDGALRSLVDNFVSQISALSESRLMERVAAALGGALGPARASAPRKERNASAAKPPAARSPAKKAKVSRPCPVPGCGKPGRGPRFRWLCDDHKGMSRAQWLAIKEGKDTPQKAAPKRAAKAKAASKPKAASTKAPKKAAAKIAAPAKRNGRKAAAKPAPAPARKTLAPASPPAQRKTVAPPAA